MTAEPALSGKTYRTTVSELIRIFQNALISLVPAMEQARIPWREGESYDAWDAITQVLFKAIVVESIQYSIFTNKTDTNKTEQLPVYDMIYESYAGMSYIGVVPQHSETPERLVFNSLVTQTSPFDTVRCCLIDDQESVVQDKFIYLLFSEAMFTYQRQSTLGRREIIQELDVEV